MYLDYPTDVLTAAVNEALTFDLHDLGRIEQMVLRGIRGEYFRLDDSKSPSANADDNDPSIKEPDHG